MKRLTTLLLAISMVFHVSAQKELDEKQWNFEFGIGLTSLGPASEMNHLMNEYGFDEDSYNWFAGGTQYYPDHNMVGFSYQISYSSDINPHSRLGLQFNHSLLSEVRGYSYAGGYLSVRFSSMSFIPFYTYALDESVDVQVGPTLMINMGNKTRGDGPGGHHSNGAPGLLTGISVKILDGQEVHGRLNVHYLFSAPSKMGPFSASRDATVTIPESKMGFSHLSIGFVLGFHGNQL